MLKDAFVQVLSVTLDWSELIVALKRFVPVRPNPVAVPEFVMVAPLGIVIVVLEPPNVKLAPAVNVNVSPLSPRVNPVPVAGLILFACI